MHFLNVFLFTYLPYIAIFIFIFGSIYRYESNQYTWKSSSSQILRKDFLFFSSNLFHFGIIFLLFGHFFGLITPQSIYTKFITAQHKQMVAMIAGGFAGAICFIGLTLLLYRRIFDIRITRNSDFSDIYVLLLLYIQLVVGLLSIFESYKHINDPSVMISLANWVQGILTFSPNYSFVCNEHFIFKLHLLLGMLVLIVFPFTRLIHILSFPYLYLLRSGFQIVRILR